MASSTEMNFSLREDGPVSSEEAGDDDEGDDDEDGDEDDDENDDDEDGDEAGDGDEDGDIPGWGTSREGSAFASG